MKYIAHKTIYEATVQAENGTYYNRRVTYFLNRRRHIDWFIGNHYVGRVDSNDLATQLEDKFING